MSDWVRGRDELREFLSYVALYAPDEFPEEDYLEAHEQMTLSTAFEQLTKALRFVEAVEARAATTLIESARDAYVTGDVRTGSAKLLELQRELFGGP